MRKYAYLKEPLKYGDNTVVFKIMLYEAEEGIYLFEYSSLDAVLSSRDRLYDRLTDLYEDWNDLIDENGWTEMEDPLPDCQHDAFLPLRVKGRNTGRPQWGKYEIYQDGEWKDYQPD